jgi:hypothetical protein
MKKIILKVTNEDCLNAGKYDDHRNCLICTAAKRQFKTQNVTVGPGSVHIDGHNYRYAVNDISGDADGVMRAYYENIQGTKRKREDLMPELKGFRPFSLILTS